MNEVLIYELCPPGAAAEPASQIQQAQNLQNECFTNVTKRHQLCNFINELCQLFNVGWGGLSL
jgi:hypothetical protein